MPKRQTYDRRSAAFQSSEDLSHADQRSKPAEDEEPESWLGFGVRMLGRGARASIAVPISLLGRAVSFTWSDPMDPATPMSSPALSSPSTSSPMSASSTSPWTPPPPPLQWPVAAARGLVRRMSIESSVRPVIDDELTMGVRKMSVQPPPTSPPRLQAVSEEGGGSPPRRGVQPAPTLCDPRQSLGTRANPRYGRAWQPPLELRPFEMPLYARLSGGPTAHDVHQGSIGNCYFGVALLLLAEFAPHAIVAAIAEEPEEEGEESGGGARLYSVRLAYQGRLLLTLRVDSHFYVQPAASPKGAAAAKRAAAAAAAASPPPPIYMQPGAPLANEGLWPMVLEKAWAALLSATRARPPPAGGGAGDELLHCTRQLGKRGGEEPTSAWFALRHPSYEATQVRFAPKPRPTPAPRSPARAPARASGREPARIRHGHN